MQGYISPPIPTAPRWSLSMEPGISKMHTSGGVNISASTCFTTCSPIRVIPCLIWITAPVPVMDVIGEQASTVSWEAKILRTTSMEQNGLSQITISMQSASEFMEDHMEDSSH